MTKGASKCIPACLLSKVPQPRHHTLLPHGCLTTAMV